MSIDPEDKIRLFPQLELFDDDGNDDDDSSSEDENELWNEFQEETVEMPAEQISIIMPSALTFAERKRLNIDHLVLQETQLREGQANDALEALRNALGEKSFIFRSQVRNARSQKKKTRSWGEVKRTDVQVQAFARTYKTARTALVQLRAGKNIMDRFQEITKKDLKMSGDIIEENRIGQRNDKMAWFWRIDGKKEDNEWMKECTSIILYGHTLYSNGSDSLQS
jgi:hypothetical protein